MNKKPFIAALLITRDRPRLFARRALASVLAQKRKPDLLVVADDSAPQNLKKNKKAIADFVKKSETRVIHMDGGREFRNARRACAPAGGAGLLGGHNSARNAAALVALAEAPPTADAWIATLDDDDEWLPHHLLQASAAIKKAGNKGVDFLPAPYEYRLPQKRAKTRLPSPFNGRDFLVGNPGVEGSTFVVRLSAFLRAGGFDESLPASDDRDLCFGLSLLGGLNCAQPKKISVIYHNDNHARITQWRGGAQLEGLSRFADKYRGWMSDKEYAAFCARAKRLFGWEAKTPRAPKPPAPPARKPASAALASKDKIALVVGLIIDPRRPPSDLFADILRLSKDRRLASTDLVMMPAADSNRARVAAEAEKWRRAGLRVYCLSAKEVETAGRELGLFANSRKPRSIAINRSILHHAAHTTGRGLRNPAFWILDGDTRLHALQCKDGKPTKTTPDYVGEMLRLRAEGCDVAIGAINGAAPLPRALTTRTQMTDLLHFFARLRRPPNERHFPALTLANAGEAKIFGDYYHDCADHPHLQQPIGLLPMSPQCPRRRFVAELPRLIERVLAGDAVTRPLLSGIVGGAGGRAHRGGNTLVFDPEALSAMPNGLLGARLDNMRRQDEIWRVLGEAALGWKVATGDFAVTQSRANDPAQAPDMERLRADTAGHALSTALRRVVEGRKFNGVEALAKFLRAREANIAKAARAAARVRIATLRASFFRVAGIAETMRGMLAKDAANLQNKAAARALRKMENSFLRAARARAGEFAGAPKAAAARAAVANLPAARQKAQNCNALYPWLKNERQKNAAALLEKIAPAKKPLRFLGRGGEGSVFTDNLGVYKVLHRWFARLDIPHPEFIFHLNQKDGAPVGAVYPILRSWQDDGDLLIEMPYEKTSLYQGGLGPGMVAMLQELKDRGICLWDIKRKNLRASKDAVRLIDYGQHIQPFTKADFDLSARKAWMSWSPGEPKKDWRARLTASQTAPNMPDLDGYKNLKRAVDEFARLYRIEDTAVEQILSYKPGRVLDYGCGKGGDAVRMAQAGIEVAAYDPNLSQKARRRLVAAGVEILTKKELAGAPPFDAVLLRHVICEVEKDGDLIAALQTIRRLTKPDASVIVTACDMDRVVREKLHAVNLMPNNANSGRKFLYRKRIRINGKTRPHAHRPRQTLERLFADAGLKVVTVVKYDDMDLETFTPCGGVLQWKLQPTKAPGGELCSNFAGNPRKKPPLPPTEKTGGKP